MRIGFFTDGFLPQPNGVATSVFESAKELERRGHEVIIVAPKYPGYVDSDLNVVRLTSLKVLSRPEIRMALHLPDKSLRRVLGMDFDIIHGHGGGTITLIGWETARLKGIPFVVTYHTLWNRYTHYFLKGKVTPKMIERATKIFGNRIDHLIAPAERVLAELKSYGVKKPITVIPSGIDVEKFYNAKSCLLRKITGIKKDPILLFVGRLGKEKSVDFIIRSFALVLKDNRASQLVIIGDGPEKRKLESLSRRLGVSKKTHFLGEEKNEETPNVYKDADVFVFSSTTETQGMVVPEALASGVPVVAIDDPAFECIKNGENGFLVPKDKREFALKILSILENKELRKSLSEKAVELSESFSVGKTVDALESIYYGLLDKYNKESIFRIMSRNERGEQLYVGFLSFLITILLTRLLIFLFPSSLYPKFMIGGIEFYHSQVALAFLLLVLSGFIKSKRIGLASVVLVGAGIGWIVDEAWALINTSHLNIKDYWSLPNLILLLALFGFMSYLFTRFQKKIPPQFYIGLREQKHINPSNPRVTVVIPAYNEEQFIPATLKSLVNQTYKNFELIVVDNNSQDKTSEIAQKYGARVILEKQKGVAQARQAGFFEAKGEIIASTDSDTIVPENWLARIVSEFDRDKSLTAFGGLSNLYSGPVTARAAGRYFFKAFWVLDKILSGGWNLNGFNMAVRRSAFLKIGGFNTALTLGEDIDLAKRLREIGKVLVDINFLVFVSGRRYRNGLLLGILTYAPSYFARVFLHKDKFLNFPTIRTEKMSGSLAFLPLAFVFGAIFLLFIISNSPR